MNKSSETETEDKQEAMVRVYVWVAPETKEQLKREAKKQPRPYNSVSELIRRYIEQGLPSA